MLVLETNLQRSDGVGPAVKTQTERKTVAGSFNASLKRKPWLTGLWPLPVLRSWPETQIATSLPCISFFLLCFFFFVSRSFYPPGWWSPRKWASAVSSWQDQEAFQHGPQAEQHGSRSFRRSSKHLKYLTAPAFSKQPTRETGIPCEIPPGDSIVGHFFRQQGRWCVCVECLPECLIIPHLQGIWQHILISWFIFLRGKKKNPLPQTGLCASINFLALR